MQIRLEDGLLVTSIHITINGASKTIHNIIIDTGAAHSLLSSDAVDDMNIRYVKQVSP